MPAKACPLSTPQQALENVTDGNCRCECKMESTEPLTYGRKPYVLSNSMSQLRQKPQSSRRPKWPSMRLSTLQSRSPDSVAFPGGRKPQSGGRKETWDSDRHQERQEKGSIGFRADVQLNVRRQYQCQYALELHHWAQHNGLVLPPAVSNPSDGLD